MHTPLALARHAIGQRRGSNAWRPFDETPQE
jgi:hypothetical protein